MAQSGEGKPRVVIDGHDAAATPDGPGAAEAPLRLGVVEPMRSEPMSLGSLSRLGSTPSDNTSLGEVL
jgi:hypothetical protein